MAVPRRTCPRLADDQLARGVSWRVMILKKISTMLSQLPLASLVVPGERGRHSHRYRRQMAGSGGCVVVSTARRVIGPVSVQSFDTQFWT